MKTELVTFDGREVYMIVRGGSYPSPRVYLQVDGEWRPVIDRALVKKILEAR